VRRAPRAAASQARRSMQVTQLTHQEDPQGVAVDMLAGRMLQLLIHFPALLHKSAVEETLSHLTIRDAKRAALRDVLLASLEYPELDDPQALLAYITRQLPGYTPQAAHVNDLSVQTVLTLENAWQLWNETVAAYQIASLQAELHALHQENAQDM